MSETQREMTLEEWVGRLPDCHLVNRQFRDLKSKLTEAESDIANAVKCAKEYCPDYPRALNTASEAVFSCGEALKVTERANDELHAALAARPKG